MTRYDGPTIRVHQKWGFGMAPVKPEIQARRVAWADAVLELLDHDSPTQRGHEQVLEALSEAKGLFNRVHRADQWDWFTVWMQLGRLSPQRGCAAAAQALAAMRRAWSTGHAEQFEKASGDFRRSGGLRALSDFRHGRRSPHEVGLGYLYVLSTREQPDLLKIGCTSRDVVARVNEINRATGIVIPYGVRGVWAVAAPQRVETAVHQVLAPYRVRPDREFFHLPMRVAVREISRHLRDQAAER